MGLSTFVLGRHARRAVASIGLAAALVVGLPAPSHAETNGPGPVAEWGTTKGTDGRVYIADAQGRAMQFHGTGTKTSTPATSVTDKLLAQIAERGLDHLRLGFFWQDLEPEQGQFDEAFLDQLVTVLDRAEDHGIKVILDMHQDVFGQSFNSKGIPSWATRTDGLPFEAQESWLLDYLQPAVQAAWEHLYEDADIRQWQIDAWVKVVERVQGHPALFGYDLLNEPFGKIRPGEDLFTAAARVEREQLTPMYQRITDAIVAVDPHHWVFVEPPNLASLGIATSLGEVKGPKVAVYPHMYDADIETATYAPDGKIQLNPEFFAKWENAISTYTDKYDVPMLVGEWGVASPELPGMDVFVEQSLQTLDRVASGWSQWALCNGEGYCPIDADGNDRPGIGQIFQPYARAIAGAPTSTNWNRQTRTLEVRFSGSTATGTTDIFIGAGRTYPDGWKVESSDAEGTWSQSYNATTGVLSITSPRSPDARAICVKPQSAPVGCLAIRPVTQPSAPTTPPAPPAGPTGPAAARPARPVTSNPTFTG